MKSSILMYYFFFPSVNTEGTKQGMIAKYVVGTYWSQKIL
jgi:hypothetical protein